MLGQVGAEIRAQQDARKVRLDAGAAWNLLAEASTVLAVKGRKVNTWRPAEDSREAILADAMGPSGNLRAPTLRIGDTIVVGFDAETYARLLG